MILTRQECTDTWNPNLIGWLVEHKCSTAAEREQYQINWRIKYKVREAEARYMARVAAGEEAA